MFPPRCCDFCGRSERELAVGAPFGTPILELDEFVTQWQDGITVWRSEDGSAAALVKPDGSVRVEHK